MPKTSRGEGNREEVSPSPADYGAWGTIISTPSGIRGGFGVFSAWKNTLMTTYVVFLWHEKVVWVGRAGSLRPPSGSLPPPSSSGCFKIIGHIDRWQHSLNECWLFGTVSNVTCFGLSSLEYIHTYTGWPNKNRTYLRYHIFAATTDIIMRFLLKCSEISAENNKRHFF